MILNRRRFLKLSCAAAPIVSLPSVWATSPSPTIAFTFDDPKTDEGAGLSSQQINERILTALGKHHIKAVLFVTGKRADSEAGRNLVTAWDRAGHSIGNHSYSHLFFNN